jgi:outer membrane protein assembly factor BamB
VLKECHYYKRVSHPRAALVLVLAFCAFARPSASIDDERASVWPVDAGWSHRFTASDTISIALGHSRLLVIEAAQISARNWSDGAEVWKRDLTATGRPVADEGHVFVPTADAIVSLSDATGAEQWRRAGRAAFSPSARAGWLIVAGEDGSLQGVSTAQGREVWRIDLPAALATQAVIEGDLVIGACADGVVRAWQIADGALRWSREIGTLPTQLTSAYGHVFVGGRDGRLMSVRHGDGRLNWSYAFHMPIVGRLAVDARHVYAATIDNTIHAHSFNGHQAWHKLLAARVIDGLLSDSGMVFVPQSTGDIRIFLAKGGARAGRLNATPANATVVGALIASGSGPDLRLALTAEAGAQIELTTYRRTGIAAVPASEAPPSTPLELTRPGGHP